jgi:hypothetical protein
MYREKPAAMLATDSGTDGQLPPPVPALPVAVFFASQGHAVPRAGSQKASGLAGRGVDTVTGGLLGSGRTEGRQDSIAALSWG